MNINVTGLPLEATQGLVDHHPRMREAVAFACRPSSQQKRTHARRLTDAQGADIRFDKLHGVIDGKPRRHQAAG